MNDILPGQSARWEELEAILREWLSLYGYQNVRTPVLEQTRLFARGIGEVTDIVEKEMYTFSMSADREDMMTMRPEFTAGIVRATIEHNLLYERAQKLYTMGPVFRHERPQKGRYRQFHQISVEALGFAGPDVDAEQIIMLARLWKMLGINDIRLELNSLGQTEERRAHREALISHLEKHKAILDADGQRRMYSNPLRVLDTKNPAMQQMANEAPRLFDFLGTESRAHFDAICQRLSDMNIAYTLNPRLVRGLDYYNLTVFEWVTDRLGAQGTVCGGGRYDGLIELLGGKTAPAVGFAIGLERLLALWLEDRKAQPNDECDVYFVHGDAQSARVAAGLAESARDLGVRCVVHPGSGSFKSQFKKADASGARLAVILGESELAEGNASVKFLRADADGSVAQQFSVAQSELAAALRTRLRDR